MGRWFNIDPLAERYRRWSPYTYSLNNPVFFVDPDGRSIDPNNPTDIEEITVVGVRKSSFPYDNPNISEAANRLYTANKRYTPTSSGIMTGAITMAGITATADGPLLFGDAAGAMIITAGSIIAGVYYLNELSEAAEESNSSEIDSSSTESSGSIEDMPDQEPDGDTESTVSENRKGGGNNGQHKSLKAKKSAQAEYEEALANYNRLKSKPNKTPQDKKDLKRAETQKTHWKKKADETGENHANKAKGSN